MCPRSILALILAGVLWGTSDVAGKTALQHIPPVTLAGLRFAIAAAVLFPIALRFGGTRLRHRRIALMGVLGFGATFLLQNAGLQSTSASNASMMQGFAPIFVIVGAHIFLNETLGRTRVIGSCLALFGIVVLTGAGPNGFSRPNVGDLYILGSAAGFACFILIGRPIFREFGAVPVLSGASIWATVLLAPLAIGEIMSGATVTVDVDTAALVLYLGVGCSALTYLLWGYALRRIEAGSAAVFDNVIPIVGLVAAICLLGERPGIWQMVGGGLVAVGAWVTNRSDSPTRVATTVAPVEFPALSVNA